MYVIAILLISLLLRALWPCFLVRIAVNKYYDKKGTLAGMMVGGLALWPLASVLIAVLIGKYGGKSSCTL